jgi:predicted RNA binding protein YcfA (HicA-like mRNA interferase family)
MWYYITHTGASQAMTSPNWKLKQKIEQNPKNVSFKDLQTLLESFGFTLRAGKGSHIFVKRVGCQPFPIPFDRPLKQVYVKKALSRINELIAEGESDE